MSEHAGSVPRVVVALPVHNGAATLATAIQSALAQTGIDLTCVVSQNWSTDSTASIVEELSARDPRLCVVRPEQLLQGTESFLFAFQRARTYDPDLFTWLAADDQLVDGYLARASEQLALCPEAEFVTADVEFISADSMARLSVRSSSPGLCSTGTLRRLWSYSCQPRWNEIYSVYRPSSFDALSLIAEPFGSDVILIWRLLLRGPAAHLDMIGTRYSIRNDGPKDTIARLRYKFRRAREGQPPQWLRLWGDLFKVAGEAPSNKVRRQARAILVVAWFHPNWLRKFAEEAFRRPIYFTARRSRKH